MKRLILLFIILLFAVWLGVQLSTDPGYVLIAYQGWTIEMPLWTLLLLFFIVFVVLGFCFRLIKAILYLPANYRHYRNTVAYKKAAAYTDRGFSALATGHWQTAEKYFKKALALQPESLTTHLAIIQAAHAQNGHEKYDAYLQQASATQSNESAKTALTLMQAQHHIEKQHFDKASTALQALHPATTQPKHPLTASLLKQVYLHKQDWPELLRLLPYLKRFNLITTAEYQQLEQSCYRNVLETATAATAAWHTVPRHLKTQPVLIACYAQQLVKQQQLSAAETLLRQTLNKHWNKPLIQLYGTIITDTPNKQLAWAEKQLTKHRADPDLLLALGHLAIANKLWGKARHYLEQNIHHQPNAAAYAALAQLLEQLNEPTTALKYYRSGLAICTQHLQH